MKRVRWGIYAATAGIAVLGIVAAHKVVASIFVHQQTSIILDPLFSHQLRNDITAFCMQHKPRTFSAKSISTFIAAVCQKFSCVKTVNAHYCAPKTLLIEVEAKQPVLRVNDSLLAANDGTVLHSDMFAQNRVSYLPHITVCDVAHESGAAAQKLSGCLQDIVALHKEYKINWINSYEMRLEDKQQGLFSIICNAAHMPDKKVLHHCQRLKSDLETQGVFVAKNAKKAAKPWLADVRFAQQIILYSDNSGGVHG
jgi:hypothetical protein